MAASERLNFIILKKRNTLRGHTVHEIEGELLILRSYPRVLQKNWEEVGDEAISAQLTYKI